MRKHDVSVRRIEVARERSSDKISRKQSCGEVFCQKEVHGQTKESPEDPALSASANDSPELMSGAGNTKARKRRRRGKKDTEKKRCIDQPTQKEQDPLSYDETLLAVIGILDATKRETNVAAWMRSGGPIQLPMEREDEMESVESDETIESLLKMEMFGDENQSSENEDGPGSKQVSFLPLEIPSPGEADCCTEIKIEPSRVQVDEPSPGRRVEGEDDVEHQLWFNYPLIKAFWVSRGRKALKELEIDIVSGVIGPIG